MPENSAEPGIKTLAVRKKDSPRLQTHPPFLYFGRTHTIIGQQRWFIGNFIYLCNVENKKHSQGTKSFPAPDVFAFKYCDGPSNLCEVASLLLNSSKITGRRNLFILKQKSCHSPSDFPRPQSIPLRRGYAPVRHASPCGRPRQFPGRGRIQKSRNGRQAFLSAGQACKSYTSGARYAAA